MLLHLALLVGCYPEPAVEPCQTPITVYADEDADGYGDIETAEEVCETVPEGRVEQAGDCDDTDPEVVPEAEELCDALDNDCDGAIDEDLERRDYYVDADGDGFGVQAGMIWACARPGDGYVRKYGDCDDTNAATHPDAVEVCDGFDNDCDDLIDDRDDQVDPSTKTLWYTDDDIDGYGTGAPIPRCDGLAGLAEADGDCDDTVAAINPGATEVCGGGDEDCDGRTDDNDPSLDPNTTTTWYFDGDGDGFGIPGSTDQGCMPPANHVDNADDCDDGDPIVTEVVDWFYDADLDGVGGPILAASSCLQPAPGTAPGWLGFDCDDNDPLRFPGNPETCEDGIDNDCNAGTGDECSLFFEDFEDGDWAGWFDPTSGQTPGIDSIGADGTSRSFRMNGGASNHYQGIYQSFTPGIRPSEVRYMVRTNNFNGDKGYVVFGGTPISSQTVAFCWLSGMYLQCYDGWSYHQTALTPNVWHEVVLQLDWPAQRFDFLVDGTVVSSNVPFRGPAASLREFHLYNFGPAGVTAWWDQIDLRP